MTFSVAYWILEIIVLQFSMQGKILLSILMASVMCLHLFLNILIPHVICIRFSQHVDYCVT